MVFFFLLCSILAGAVGAVAMSSAMKALGAE